jgi:hypothetical protein
VLANLSDLRNFVQGHTTQAVRTLTPYQVIIPADSWELANQRANFRYRIERIPVDSCVADELYGTEFISQREFQSVFNDKGEVI